MADKESVKCKSFVSTTLKIGLEGPFTISDQQWHPGYAHFLHQISRLPSGRLILSIGKERDRFDQERFLLISDDNGKDDLEDSVVICFSTMLL